MAGAEGGPRASRWTRWRRHAHLCTVSLPSTLHRPRSRRRTQHGHEELGRQAVPGDTGSERTPAHCQHPVGGVTATPPAAVWVTTSACPAQLSCDLRTAARPAGRTLGTQPLRGGGWAIALPGVCSSGLCPPQGLAGAVTMAWSTAGTVLQRFRGESAQDSDSGLCDVWDPFRAKHKAPEDSPAPSALLEIGD